MYYERKIDFLSFDTRETQRPCKYVVKRQKMTSYATATLAKEARASLLRTLKRMVNSNDRNSLVDNP